LKTGFRFYKNEIPPSVTAIFANDLSDLNAIRRQKLEIYNNNKSAEDTWEVVDDERDRSVRWWKQCVLGCSTDDWSVSKGFWEMLARSYGGLASYSETVHRAIIDEKNNGQKTICFTQTEIRNAKRLYSTNKNDSWDTGIGMEQKTWEEKQTKDRKWAVKKIETAFEKHVPFDVGTWAPFKQSTTKNNYEDNPKSDLRSGIALASPAVISLFINIGAYNMAENETSEPILTPCYFSQPKVNNREINSEMYRKLYTTKNDAVVSLVQTCMGNRSGDNNASIGISSAAYVLHPYSVATTHNIFDPTDHRCVRSVNGYFPTSLGLYGNPTARTVCAAEVKELYEKLFNSKFEETNQDVVYLLAELMQKMQLDYDGLKEAQHWAALYWRLREISGMDKPSKEQNQPKNTPMFMDDLMFQTRILFNSITKIRFAFLDGMGRMEATLSTQMLRRPERTIPDLVEMDRCNIPLKTKSKGTPYEVMGRSATCYLMIHKKSTPGHDMELSHLEDLETHSANIQKSAGENQNRGVVDFFSKIVDNLLMKSLPPIAFDLEKQGENAIGHYRDFCVPGIGNVTQKDQFTEVHNSFMNTLEKERSGVGFDLFTQLVAKVKTEKRFAKAPNNEVAGAAHELLKSTLVNDYSMACSVSTMKSTPSALYTLAIMTTDFCHDKKSAENMRAFVVLGGLKQSVVPVKWTEYTTRHATMRAAAVVARDVTEEEVGHGGTRFISKGGISFLKKRNPVFGKL
jgi:hypothetical protein